MQSDGSVSINVELDDEKALQELKELKKEIEETPQPLEKKKNYQQKLVNTISKIKTGVQAAARAFGTLSRAAVSFASGLLSGVAKQGLKAFRDYFFDIARSIPEVRESIAEIKGNLLTTIQPIVNVLLPVLQTLLEVLVQVTAVMADIVAKLFKTTVAQSKESAEALYEQAEAYKAAGGAATKAGKQLARFDELNVLSDPGEKPSFEGNMSPEVEGQLGALELLIGESLLALGAILTFTGVNIPLGLALMALGAAAIVSAAHIDWELLKKQMEGPIGEIFTLVSLSLLVLGAILAFSGVNLPLGIALIAIGAAGLAASVALNWDKIRKELTGPMALIYAVLAASLLVIGAILAFSGISIPLGIALMAAGAAGLATITALNWEKIKEELTGPMAAIYGVISAAVLVIGAILVFSGISIPLGIALMAAGAAGLATVTALNWDKVKEELTGPMAGIYMIVSAAVLVIGAILVFSGVSLPLGIALMVAGAAGLAAVVALNWDNMKNILSGQFAGIVAIASAALLVLGAILTFSGAALPLGIGLMIAGAAGLAAVAIVNWDTIKQALQGPIGEVVAIVSAALLVLGAVLTFSGAAIPLGIGLMVAGAAGLATTAAVNWDSIKEALQGPIGKVAAFVSGALLVLGIILTAAGIFPIGIALIAAGAAGLVTVTELNWDAIREKIIEIWNSIATWWRSNVAPIFTQRWWADKFSSISEGLKQKVKDGVNAAIDLFNRFIDWINEKLHIEWSAVKLFGAEVIPAGSFQLLTIPRIPRLAQGAVIPPNREFMAVLGDQKHGTNIETPLDTMVQAFRQAISEGGTLNGREPKIELRVYLDSKEIKTRQQVLSRVTGG